LAGFLFTASAAGVAAGAAAPAEIINAARARVERMLA